MQVWQKQIKLVKLIPTSTWVEGQHLVTMATPKPWKNSKLSLDNQHNHGGAARGYQLVLTKL